MDFKHEIIVITGQRDAGKTILCLKLILQLKTINKTVKGIVSPGLYVDDRKVGILARDIASEEEKQFAKYSLGWNIEKPECEWRFFDDGISWANVKIKDAIPTDILLIDEIGFLELEENKGWTAALENLDKGLFNHAIVVIRPDLLPLANNRWEIDRIVTINPGDNIKALSDNIIDQLTDKA